MNNTSLEEENDISITIGPFLLTTEELGQGNFGIVYKGIHNETKEKVAIKVIRKKDIKVVSKKNDDEDDEDDDEVEKIKIKEKIELDYKELLDQELDILKELHHPYICRFLYKTHYYEDYYIVTEYISGKDFVDSDIDFNEQKICKAFCQILSAIEYLHKNSIVHRDIKIENILFDEYGDAKLIDFGFSKKVKINELIGGSRGSDLYAAPEILFTERNHKYDGFLSDIWSLGVCFYCMMFNYFPFLYKDKDKNIFYYNLANEDLIVPENNDISPEFKDLIKRILNKEPNKRLTLSQIKQHKWVHSLDFNFMKSPGISLDKEILPIDLDVIKEMAGNNINNITKLIKDILTNEHNKYTCTYYLKIDQKKRKNIKSIADIRPSSELFLNYINSEKSKLKYYNNDINKVVKELTERIIKQKQEEELKFNNIKKSININNKKNLLNKSVIDRDDNKVNSGVSKLRSRSFGKLKDLKKYLKEENKKEENNDKDEINGKKIIKVKKINILDTYRNNIIFITGIIDDIINKALNSIKSEEKEKANIQKQSDIIINKNNFTINMIEEFNFAPDIKKADKTAPFGFYKPKNKLNNKNNNRNKNNNNIEAEISEEKIKNKLYDKNQIKNKNKKNKIESKNLMTNRYNHSSINIKRPENKKIKILKTEENKINSNNINNNINNNKISQQKKGGLLHSFKKTISNAVKTIKKTFYKRNKEPRIQKPNIKNTKLKSQIKSKSTPKNNIKNDMSKLFNDNDINIILTKKRPNTFKKEMKKKSSNKTKEQKLEKKAGKFINKNKEVVHSLDKDLDTNLNINKVLSEKNNRNNNISKLKKDLYKNKIRKKANLSMTYSSSPIKIPDKKNTTRTITHERNTYNIQNTNNTITINNQVPYKRKAKIAGRTYIIYHKDKNKNNKTIENNNNNPKINKKLVANKSTTKLSPKKATPIKSNIFVNNTSTNNKKTSLKIKQSIYSSIETVSKDTIDTSSRKKTKTRRNSINKKIRMNSIDSTNIKTNESDSKHEIKIKKDLINAEKIITNYFGDDKIKVNKSKTGTKFVMKMFLGKKKLEFILNLVQIDKKNCIITGELIEGDLNNFDKIFSQLKEKLK